DRASLRLRNLHANGGFAPRIPATRAGREHLRIHLQPALRDARRGSGQDRLRRLHARPRDQNRLRRTQTRRRPAERARGAAVDGAVDGAGEGRNCRGRSSNRRRLANSAGARRERRPTGRNRAQQRERPDHRRFDGLEFPCGPDALRERQSSPGGPRQQQRDLRQRRGARNRRQDYRPRRRPAEIRRRRGDFENFGLIDRGEWGVGSGEWGVGIGSGTFSPLPIPHSPFPSFRNLMNFPFIATIVLLIGMTGLILALGASTWRYRSRAAKLDQADAKIPEDFGPRLTSRRLRYVRWAFALMVVAALVFHVYWGLFASGPLGESPVFAALKNKRDQRNRREAESALRGWIYDRHHDSRRALAKYRYL